MHGPVLILLCLVTANAATRRPRNALAGFGGRSEIRHGHAPAKDYIVIEINKPIIHYFAAEAHQVTGGHPHGTPVNILTAGLRQEARKEEPLLEGGPASAESEEASAESEEASAESEEASAESEEASAESQEASAESQEASAEEEKSAEEEAPAEAEEAPAEAEEAKSAEEEAPAEAEAEPAKPGESEAAGAA